MRSNIVESIKNLTTILPVITLTAYSIAFAVLFLYLSDIQMPYSVITTLTVSDYIVLFVIISVASLYITYIICQPLIVLSDLYLSNASSNYNEVNIGRWDKIINKVKCVLSNKLHYAFNTFFPNAAFAVIAGFALSDYIILKWWVILLLAFVFKYIVDVIFSLVPKITAIIFVINLVVLVVYKADILIKYSGYGNVDKFIVSSEKPEIIIGNLICFKQISSGNGKIYITPNKVHLGLITKDNFYIKINNSVGKDYVKLSTDTYSAFSGLICNICHSK